MLIGATSSDLVFIMRTMVLDENVRADLELVVNLHNKNCFGHHLMALSFEAWAVQN